MKRVTLIIFLITVLLVSCKKSRTCTCTVVTSGMTNTRTQTDGFPPTVPATDTTISVPLNTTDKNSTTFQKVTKSRAKNSCLDRTENVNESTQNGIPGLVTITVTNTGTRVYSCELE